MAMKLKRMLGSLVIGAIVLVVAAVLVVRFLVRDADTGFVDLATLQRSASGNDALFCPFGACPASPRVWTEPVADTADALTAKVLDLPGKEPRVTLVARDDANRRYVLVQRSLVFNFPDTVNIAIRALDADHATLAIYSRSKYGRGDFGVNEARAFRWLRLLGVKVVGSWPK